MQHTLLASHVWNVATVQTFQFENTISDMMIHLFLTIKGSKIYQIALFCVLFQQLVVLLIIIQILSYAS